MTMRVLLLDIGAGDLPAITPVVPVMASWMPVVYKRPEIPVPGNFTVQAVTDGILMTWDAVAIDGVVYVIERAPDVDGAPGAWVEIARTKDLRYTYTSSGEGLAHYRIRASVLGYASLPSPALPAEPIDMSHVIDDVADALAAALAAQQAIDAEALARFEADAAAAANTAAGLAQVAADAAAAALAQQVEIDAARAAVAEAQTRIDQINDDEIISPAEKPQLIIDFNAIVDERSGIQDEAVLSEVVDELAAYDIAFDNLANYMATLTTPVRWDDTSDITNLV